MKNHFTKALALAFFLLSAPVVFAQPLGITIMDMTTKCGTFPVGTLNPNAFGGTGPYTYTWYDGTWAQLYPATSSLPPTAYGTYHCVVTDMNTDKDTASLTISQQLGPTITTIPVELYGTAHTGCGTAEGTLDIDIEGSTPPYQVSAYTSLHPLPVEGATPIYTSNTSDTLVSVENLSAGIYTVVVVSNGGMGCTSWAMDTLVEPSPLTIDLEGTLYPNEYYVSCDTCHDAEFEMTVNNANGSVTTLWLNPGEDFSPKGWLHGATKSELKVFSEEEKPDGIDPSWILSATTQVNSLSPNVWYYAFAIDQAQCLAVQSLVIEKPKPTFAWGWEGNTGTNKWLGTNDSTDLRLWTDSTERMVIKADGNIGIGTTTPEVELDLNGDARITGNLTLTNLQQGDWDEFTPLPTCPTLLGWDINGTVVPLPADDYCLSTYLNHVPLSVWRLQGNDVEDDMYIGTNNYKPFKVKTHGTEKLRIETDGNVGIATTSPQEKFHVLGNARIGESDAYLKMGYNGSNGIIDYYGSGNFLINWYSGKNVHINGNLSIGEGAVDNGSYTLNVCGEIKSKKVTVSIGWCDYVFDRNYELMTLKELEEFITVHQHLPYFPTQEEIETKGADVGDLISKQMRTIEELTLQVIKLNKEVQSLRNQISSVKE